MSDWRKLSPAEIDEQFASYRARDPLGLKIHLAFAALACFFAGWPTAYVSWAALPLLIVFIVRMFTHHKSLGPLFYDPISWLTLAWSAWLALSLLWSRDRATGLDEVGQLAWGLYIPLLYPVLDRRRVLIAALILGILCGNATQLAHALGLRFDLHWLTWNRLPGRNSGWWDPVVGGSILCAALGLHLGGLAFGRSLRERCIAAAGTGITIIALVATGTRGAWIGAVGLVLAMTLVAMLSLARHTTNTRRRMPRKEVAALIAAMLIAGLLWAGFGLAFDRLVEPRFRSAVKEVEAALDGRDYNTDTGRRIAMWQWAWAAWRCEPILGVGAGGYRAWVQHEAALHASADPNACPHHGPLTRGGADVHDHAHGTIQHAAATTGAIGAAILLVLGRFAFLGGFKPVLTRPREDRWTTESGYERAGPGLALLGLACAGIFDSLTVNQQTWNLAMILVALSVSCRPREATGSGSRVAG